MRLEKYYEDVASGDHDVFEDSVKFVEISDIATLLGDLTCDNFDMLILQAHKEENMDDIMELAQQRARSGLEFNATVIILPSELLQFKALSVVRNLAGGNPDIRITPLLFSGKSKVSGDFAENLEFGILFGVFTVLDPPMNIYHSSLNSLYQIMEKICPPCSSVAVVADASSSLVLMHSNILTRKVTYFGYPDDLVKLQTQVLKHARSESKAMETEVEASDSVDAAGSNEVELNLSNNEKDPEPKEPVKEGKIRLSDVFEYEDDPDVLKIMSRKKREADELAARTQVKTRGRKRKNMSKMAKYSQSISSNIRIGFKKIPKKRIARPSKVKFVEKRDQSPSIDEILRLPESVGDGGKSMDDVLDEIDLEIAERHRKHEVDRDRARILSQGPFYFIFQQKVSHFPI